jgi:hypothetical protein
MQEDSEQPAKRTIDERRKETDRVYAEIVEAERKAQLEKHMRLRSVRVVKQ